MFCKKCGKETLEGNFCQYCGSSQTDDKIYINKNLTSQTISFQNKLKEFYKTHTIAVYIIIAVIIGSLLLFGIGTLFTVGTMIVKHNEQAKQEEIIQQAQTDFQLGEYESAYDTIQKILSEDSNNKEALTLRDDITAKWVEQLYQEAIIKRDEGWYVESYDLILKILELDPNNENAQIVRTEITSAAMEQKAERERMQEAEKSEQERIDAEKKAQSEAESKAREAEKQQKVQNLVNEYEFDGELAVVILQTTDVSDYYTCKYGNMATDADGTYYPVSTWSDILGYNHTYKVYSSGKTSNWFGYSEKDAKKHTNASGKLTKKAVTSEIQEPENTTAPSSTQTKPQNNTAYQFKYESSIGYIIVADGTKIEYFHDSPGLLCYNLKDYTSSQMGSFYNNYAGQYIVFTGEIEEATADGMVQVYCIDEQATRDAGLLWPMAAYVELQISPQSYNMSAFSKGAALMAMGKVQYDCYSDFLGVPTLKLTEGIILQ